ncbi:MAG: hypothetical protein Tsb009_06400 [Planctomycetaceae bacterium]
MQIADSHLNDASLEEPWQRQRLRVPRENARLIERPPLEQCVEPILQNVKQLENSDVNIQGRPLSHMRTWSRRELLQVARTYTADLLGNSLEKPDDEHSAALPATVIVGGHQPTLFHAGVWVKNFAIHRLAQQTGGVSVNLVVDNDTRSVCSIRVPSGTRNHPRRTSIPFDDPATTGPWEEARIVNRSLAGSFAERVESAMAVWSIRPILSEMWPAVLARAEVTDLWADCLTAGRASLERHWGVRNLELPISRMCTVDSFLWFASHLFAHAGRFRDLHNDVLAQFRKVNRVRSRTHPVPELMEQDGWIESPFWVWNQGDSQRGRLMVKQVGKEVHLAANEIPFARLPLTPTMDACCAVEVLRELPARGIRLRTRALSTTLFSRLCLGDWFVHGIGGSKYDEMTDRIIARFFGMRPPKFLTLSGTLHLPLAEPHPISPEEIRRLENQRRDVRYNPDRYLTPEQREASVSLLAEKERLIAAQHMATSREHQSRRERRQHARENHERYLAFKDVNRKLAHFTRDIQSHLEQQIEAAHQMQEANLILQNREYPFCLFPEDTIRPFMTSILKS